ncbi:MAG: hypothetical protein NTY53_25810 [Kiritimatiellaeota bacterium]|nr:hypothetical protein [Kiritimatiellota bacterium]
MKRRILVALLLGVGVALAAPPEMTKLPASVRKVEHIKDAMGEAKQQKKALLFILSEITKKEGGKGNKLVLEATQLLITKLRGQCVMIYVDFNTDRAKLAKELPKVNEAFDSETLKKSPIPRAVATDAAGQKFFALVPYSPPGPLGDEMLKEAKQQIADGLAGKLKTDDVGIATTKDRQIALPPDKQDKKQGK